MRAKNEGDWNLPKIEGRKYAETAAINPTPINNKKVVLKCADAVIKKGGFFSSDYIMYKVSTEPLGWKVERKDADFFLLRKIMRAQFPHILIPPLPNKQHKMTPKALTKREKQF